MANIRALLAAISRRQNIDVLRDDERWLIRLLSNQTSVAVFRLVCRWSEIWREKIGDHDSVEDQNNGRSAANRWIREEVIKLRHNEPEIVKKYRASIAEPVPKVCHTCEHYSPNGACELFNQKPPEDFAATVDACKDWREEIPF